LCGAILEEETAMSEVDIPDTEHEPEHGGYEDHDDHVILAQYTDGSHSLVADTDHDGYANVVAYDGDGDGNYERAYSDEYGHDDKLDTLTLDNDDDGDPDTFLSDRNADGKVDLAALDRNDDDKPDLALIDTDFDGKVDTAVADQNFDGKIDILARDLDEDGDFDKVYIDTDYDGKVDQVLNPGGNPGGMPAQPVNPLVQN
jgi:hypothetical protein